MKKYCKFCKQKIFKAQPFEIDRIKGNTYYYHLNCFRLMNESRLENIRIKNEKRNIS